MVWIETVRSIRKMQLVVEMRILPMFSPKRPGKDKEDTA